MDFALCNLTTQMSFHQFYGIFKTLVKGYSSHLVAGMTPLVDQDEGIFHQFASWYATLSTKPETITCMLLRFQHRMGLGKYLQLSSVYVKAKKNFLTRKTSVFSWSILRYQQCTFWVRENDACFIHFQGSDSKNYHNQGH